MKNYLTPNQRSLNSKIFLILFLCLFFVLWFSNSFTAEYRIDLTYNSIPLYVDEYGDEGYYIGFR